MLSRAQPQLRLELTDIVKSTSQAGHVLAGLGCRNSGVEGGGLGEIDHH